MGKKRIVTILIVIATVVLAGVAIFTAVRLYQLRQEAVAPTAPTSKPEAATDGCSALSFTLTTGSPSPTPSGSASPTPSESPTASPSESPTSTATASASPTTTEAELPEAGTSYPTIIGGVVGILLIVISLALAL